MHDKVIVDSALLRQRLSLNTGLFAAEAMRMGERIGSIARGYETDIIALDGNPLKDIGAVRRVTFVMKGGVVYKNVARGALLTHAGGQP